MGKIQPKFSVHQIATSHKTGTKHSPNDISGLSHQKSGAIHNDQELRDRGEYRTGRISHPHPEIAAEWNACVGGNFWAIKSSKGIFHLPACKWSEFPKHLTLFLSFVRSTITWMASTVFYDPRPDRSHVSGQFIKMQRKWQKNRSHQTVATYILPGQKGAN